MGNCLSGNENIGLEEQWYVNAEKLLNFCKHDSVFIDKILRKYSNSSFMTKNQWKIVKDLLKLTPETPNSLRYIEYFYEKFENDKGLVLQELLVLGIILGKGDYKDKAKLLFEAFDVYSNRILFYSDIASMIETMINIFTRDVHDLAKAFLNSNIPRELLQIYHEKLKEDESAFIKKFMKTILSNKDFITLNEFVHHFSDLKLQKILTSVGLRRAILHDKRKNLKKLESLIEIEKIGRIEMPEDAFDQSFKKKYKLSLSSEEE